MDLQSIFLAAVETAQAVEPLNEASSEGPLGTLGINWKLFVAQLINFSIVLFVFWKWIVKPLGKTLMDRQEKIERGLKNADLMVQEKKKFEEWKLGERKRVRTEADEIMRTMTDTANKLKQETIFDAEKQSEKMIKQAQTTIQSEKEQALTEVKQEVATLVVMASEKILRLKLDSKKDHELINETVKNIKN